MKKVKVLVLMIVLGFFVTFPIFTMIYGTIQGQVTNEENGKGLPGCTVHFDGQVNITIDTDNEGRYKYNLLKPGRYSVSFGPSYPYCYISAGEIVNLEPGKIVVLNKVVKLAGTLSGRVIHADGSPFPGISIMAWGRGGGVANDTTKEDGTYFLGKTMGRLCPSANYYIKAECNIPEVAYKIILPITVEKGKETKVQDIVFDLNDPTGIEGYVTSSIDGKPLKNIEIVFHNSNKKYPPPDIYIDSGRIVTNAEGYYYIKGLDPEIYEIVILPPMKNQNYYEYSAISKDKKDIVVSKGKKTKIDIKLDIPATYVDQNE